jgi:hypothetical protein
MSFDTTIWGYFGAEKKTGTTKLHTLGTRMVLPDGRAYRYGKAAEAIGAGMLGMMQGGVAHHDMDLTVAVAAAVGATSITVDLEATAATKDQYADGYIYINDANGEGHIYRIKSNPAADASATLEVTLADNDTVVEALVVDTSLAGLVANPYGAVDLFDASDVDGPPLGVAAAEFSGSTIYGWFQTWGLAAVLAEAGVAIPVIGQTVAQGAAVDGAVELSAGAVTPRVGIAASIAPVAGDYGLVFLTIAP